MTVNQHTLRVYYEDTDAGGIVYYANYLKYLERGRTEWLRALGFENSQLRHTHGVLFAVTRCEIDYAAPAKLDDEIMIVTRLKESGAASFVMAQDVKRGTVTLANATVTLACLNEDGKPTRLPDELRRVMQTSE